MGSLFARLRVAAWNACSVVAKRLEYVAFLEDQNINIFLIQKIYRFDRLVDRSGGTAVLVRSTIRHSRINCRGLFSVKTAVIRVNIRGIGAVRVFSI